MLRVVVIENFPPFAFVKSVFGRAFTPGLFDVPMGGSCGVGLFVVGADGAAAEHECSEERCCRTKPQRRRRNSPVRSARGLKMLSHYCFFPLGSGPPGLLPLGAPDLSVPLGLPPLLLGEPPWPGAGPPCCLPLLLQLASR